MLGLVWLGYSPPEVCPDNFTWMISNNDLSLNVVIKQQGSVTYAGLLYAAITISRLAFGLQYFFCISFQVLKALR